jgi:Rieske Fe-S protein
VHPTLVPLRRRTFLLGAAALACGGPSDTSDGDTGDTKATDAPGTSTGNDAPTTGSAGSDGSTGPDGTTGPVDPSTTSTTSTASSTSTGDESTSTATTGTGEACTPSGADTGLLVADFTVGACVAAMNVADTLVLRDDQGFYAMTNRCTHDGCPVPCPVGGTITCPCHGSQFNANGDVLAGPALSDLRHYFVSFECVGDAVKIYVDKAVTLDDRTTRVLPP